MNYGFVRMATATPHIKLADCVYNRSKILEAMREASQRGCRLLVLPALGVTGSTCGDLFRQRMLISEAEAALCWLAEESRALDLVTVVGAPLMASGRLYDCALVLCRGEILGAVPKSYPTDRVFTAPAIQDTGKTVVVGGKEIPFGTDLLFRHTQQADFTFAVELGEDLWLPVPPSGRHALAGALVIVNPSATEEAAGKAEYRRTLVAQQSARLMCAYVYANTGDGEDSTDRVYSGHSLIAENGKLMAETVLFENRLICSDIDLELLSSERAAGGFPAQEAGSAAYRVVPFTTGMGHAQPFERKVEKLPFVPFGTEERRVRCGEILSMQTAGLVQRLRHTGIQTITLNLSGGLDSTLALLVAVRTFDRLGLPRAGIRCLSLPCFGTSERTRGNARKLAEAYGVSFMEISIKDAVLQHFKDIGHSPDLHDLVYENAQARERTQVAMDVAAQHGGLMLGTGDLSELALGFTTYNGDHMSMYNVNGSIPKTLMRFLIKAEAETAATDAKSVLGDILTTPVSPELLPPDAEGNPSQETESIVGPYELHDFFLYYLLRYGFAPEKIRFLAEAAFEGVYTAEVIQKWMCVFYKRFFVSQYKRTCMPAGPNVGSVSLSPINGWRMPSDVTAAAWLDRLEKK